MIKTFATVAIAITLLMVFRSHLKAEFERFTLRRVIDAMVVDDLDATKPVEERLLSITDRIAKGYRSGVFDTVELRALSELKSELEQDDLDAMQARSIISRYEILLGHHGL